MDARRLSDFPQRLAAARACPDDDQQLADGDRHVGHARREALRQLLDLGVADHDPRDRVEHVAQSIVGEHDPAADPAVGG